MLPHDDDLQNFEARGAAPLPVATHQGYVENDGARIWYSTYGAGEPVILLHGGLGNSGNWGYQVPALVESGRRVILIDSRGHGRSTRDSRPYTYELMASDVVAVMDAVNVERAAVVGWSDGACIALILAMRVPSRITRVFYFACNMDPSGTKEIEWPNPVIDRCLSRHRKDYASLSATPDQFDAFFAAIGLMMKTEPNYTAAQLAEIRVPVSVAISERDEFIRLEHIEYLARTIPGAKWVLLQDVTHFAPLQRPDSFNSVLQTFLQH
jgi:pimeloyl-ACP methyl ester carboxylesterase